MTRDLDIVLLGATGFTGALTAEYMAAHAPDGLRWALAGRNRSKLEQVRERIGVDVELLEVDVSSDASLNAMAERTRSVVTTVGPYLEHGEPVVRACAEAGTDYLDLTGEPEFVDRMFIAHHATAQRTGARIVHACGFDSIPHDLGALFTVTELAGAEHIDLRGVVRASAGMSGGTFASALNQFSRVLGMRRAAGDRRRLEARDPDRSLHSGGRFRRDDDLDCWLVPLPTIDPTVVIRSAAASPAYGNDFTYAHYAGVRSLKTVAGAVAGMGGLVLAAQIPPLRSALTKRLPSGEGPSERRREKAWFSVDFIGTGDGVPIHTRVSGGDPGYGETAKMLAESALCLAFDDNPEVVGSVTTATAMGPNLIARLQAAGMGFERLA
ncbi:MAG: saccharopine dehydrogenase family protein [Nocardioides sp.]